MTVTQTDLHETEAAIASEQAAAATSPAEPTPRKWVRYAVGGGVLIAVIVIIVVFATTSWSAPTNEPIGAKSPMQLADVYNGRLAPKPLNGRWHGRTGQRVQFNRDGDLVLFDPLAGRELRLLDADTAGLNTSRTQQLSADGQFVLLEQFVEQRYFHSRRSRFDLFEVNGTRPMARISATRDAADTAVLDYATFGPRGSQLAFVQNQNLYYLPSAQKPTSVVPLTNSSDAAVFSGLCDWAYEEEIFARGEALWWAPDGRRLAYAQFDDRAVREVTLHRFGSGGQYSVGEAIRYPKVGTENPRVRLLWVALPDGAGDAVLGREVELAVPLRLRAEHVGDVVLTAVDWMEDQRVLAVWMNRQQNRAYVEEYETIDGGRGEAVDGRELFDITSATGWLNISEPLFRDRTQQQIALVVDIDNRRHLVTYSIARTAPPLRRQLTSTADQLHVQRVVHWNHDDDALFFLGNQLDAPQERQLYVVPKASDANTAPSVHCLTCGGAGAQHTHFEALFSAAGPMLVLVSQGPAVPRYDFYEWRTAEVSVRLVSTLEDHAELRGRLELIAQPLVRYMEVPLSAGGGGDFTARVRLQLPPGFDASAGKRYPLLVFVYAGPGTYAGRSQWTMDWSEFMCANRTVVVAQIDGRGTTRRDVRTMHAVYGRLGQTEVADQVEVAGHLAKSLDYIDAARVAIWGWSYGGYATSMALATDTANVFRCGASVSPVTDWTRYDTLYTERYMGLERDNAAGYKNGSLVERAEALRDRRYLLVHGTGDDNVHFQHSMELARKLELADIAFEQMVFPDEDHGLENVLPFLYRRLTDFIDRCFE